MTAYEDAVQEIPKLKAVIRTLRVCTGRDGDTGERNTNIDKYGITLVVKLHEAWHGYYGNSSCYSHKSELMEELLQEAARARTFTLADTAIAAAETRIKKLATRAEAEAKNVLSQVTEKVEG